MAIAVWVWTVDGGIAAAREMEETVEGCLGLSGHAAEPGQGWSPEWWEVPGPWPAVPPLPAGVILPEPSAAAFAAVLQRYGLPLYAGGEGVWKLVKPGAWGAEVDYAQVLVVHGDLGSVATQVAAGAGDGLAFRWEPPAAGELGLGAVYVDGAREFEVRGAGVETERVLRVAMAAGASDVRADRHWRAGDDSGRVRFRLDGEAFDRFVRARQRLEEGTVAVVALGVVDTEMQESAWRLESALLDSSGSSWSFAAGGMGDVMLASWNGARPGPVAEVLDRELEVAWEKGLGGCFVVPVGRGGRVALEAGRPWSVEVELPSGGEASGEAGPGADDAWISGFRVGGLARRGLEAELRLDVDVSKGEETEVVELWVPATGGRLVWRLGSVEGPGMGPVLVLGRVALINQ